MCVYVCTDALTHTHTVHVDIHSTVVEVGTEREHVAGHSQGEIRCKTLDFLSRIGLEHCLVKPRGSDFPRPQN